LRRARVLIPIAIIAVVALTTVLITTASAWGGSSKFKTTLSGYNEDPLTINTPGGGTFSARINRTGTAIDYTETFGSLTSSVTQSHIHFGGPFQSGGIVVFLCSNLGNGPAGTQACPAGGGTISGTIVPANVISVANQNIVAGDLAAVIAAIRADRAYVNVHTANFPGGEIRGPLGDHDHHHDH
jgi:CHRD domain